MPRERRTPGSLVISLDFELRWGTRDRKKPASAVRLLNARHVVRRLLDMFEASGVSCTWATVGFLFAESKEEIAYFAPQLLPTYERACLNPYGEKIGSCEEDDPLHFALSLIKSIQACPGQEIATHTFSHYYCLEPGQTPAQFSADLASACRIAQARGIKLRSIVFPRNQVDLKLLPILQQHDIECYRATAHSWVHNASAFAEQQLPYKRVVRLADAYVPLLGKDVVNWPVQVASGPYRLDASRYFRPYTSLLSGLSEFALERMRKGMQAAARTGGVYHLWFHPEDFGLYPNENLAMLRDVLTYYTQLRDEYGMTSMSMAEQVDAVRTANASPESYVGVPA